MEQTTCIYRFQIARQDCADPLSVAEIALQQVRVEAVVRDHLDTEDPKALSMHYKRYFDSNGEYTALVVCGTSEEKVLAVADDIVLACRGSFGGIEPPEVEVCEG